MKHRSNWSRKCDIVMILRGLDTGDIANMLGMNRSYVTSIISGRTLGQETINRISRILGISNTNDLSELPDLVIRELSGKEHGE